MMKSRKFLALVLVALLALSFLTSCKSDSSNDNNNAAPPAAPVSKEVDVRDLYTGEYRIAYIPLSLLGVLNVPITAAINEVLVQFPNIKVDSMEAGFDPNKQASLVNEAISQGYDAIILESADPAVLVNAVNAAEGAGIPVIAQNLTIDTVHSGKVNMSDYEAGSDAAKNIARLCNNTGNVIVLDGPVELASIRLMGKGCTDYIKNNTNMEILDIQYIPNFSQELANTAMRDLLTKYPSGEIQAIYCCNDDEAIGAIQAINAAGRQGDNIVIWGYVGEETALNAIKEGTMAGTNFQDTYLIMVAELTLANYCIATRSTAGTLGLKATPVIPMSCPAVTKDNVDTYLAINRYSK